jgi:TonB family protein
MDDASFEADFEDLAARFSAQSGGGLSPELSAELALEIVLNEVVDQACLATGATGAAIALWRDREMVCRASSGTTAPELGARLDTASGLSGECIQTQLTQRCDDALSDLRVDIDASQRLGVRSIMVMPLLRGAQLAGVFELFSSLSFAFGDRDERTLEVLARRVVSNLEHASRPKPAPLQEDSQVVNQGVTEMPPQSAVLGTADEVVESSRRRGFDSVTWALAAAVLACAILLGIAVGRDISLRRATARTRPTQTAPAGNPAYAVNPPVDAGIPSAESGSTSSKEQRGQIDVPPSAFAKTSGATPILVGGLQVFDNGKEVFRMPAGQSQVERSSAVHGSTVRGSAARGTEMQRASSEERGGVVEISPAAAEGIVLHRVEPDYPEAARQQKVQGPVVLNVRIGPNGAVQDVQVLSGDPQLAQASSDAVKQWRFKPRQVDGHPVEMQTRVTLNFRLPK